MRLSFAFLAPLIGSALAVTDGYNGQYADECPSLCAEAGPDPGNWTYIPNLHNLESCDEIVLFGFNIHNSVADPNSILTIQACVASQNQTYKAAPYEDASAQESPSNLVVAESCGAKSVKTTFTPHTGSSTLTMSSGAAPDSADVAEAARQLGRFVDASAECGTTILFAKHKSAVVGLYSGAQITKHAAGDFLSSFAENKTSALQVCQPSGAAATVGVVSSGFDDLASVQDAITTWSGGLCLDGTKTDSTVSMDVLVSTADSSFDFASISYSNLTAKEDVGALATKKQCKTQEVKKGDSCGSLASRCGISGAKLTKYNPKKNLCSTLKPKQHVCCTSGSMPDFRPQPQKDGTCNTYKIVANDDCWDIADKHYLKQKDIEGFNKKPGAGPAVELVYRLASSSVSAKERPQCRRQSRGLPAVLRYRGQRSLAKAKTWPTSIHALSMHATPADTGAPGTAKKGTNSCISNCGMDIVNNDKGPDELMTISYFEAFDQLRACLRMRANEIPSGQYSHVHFAFATVTPSFAVDITQVEDEFRLFMKTSGFKKILSFGGWAFSTDSDTFQRFRDATKKGNRDKFVDKLVDFMDKNNLDGFDFDWEYPGAPDIPNIPPGGSDEGKNYRDFLKLLRSKLPKDKSISIALPASYWYLKQYPVKDMQQYVDYFIYMTYDLHGQWDAGNKYATPGCEGGNCLRSHINKTETHDAMVMITKAGVESRKLVIGVSSYGRSFRMNDESCSGPLCTYAGDSTHSMAYRGSCTATSGYIANRELADIIKDHGNYSIYKSYTDKASDSNILMYGEPGKVDWVAYMGKDIKAKRIDWIKGLNFGGSSDWAIDLISYSNDENAIDSDFLDDSYNESGEEDLYCSFDKNPGNLDDLANQADSLDEECIQLYAMDILHQQILDSLDIFQTKSDGYDDKFGWYEKWTKEHIKPRLDEFMSLTHGKGRKYFDCYWAYLGNEEKKDSCLDMPKIWEQAEAWNIRFDLVDEKGFYDALAAETGIDKSWVKFGDDDSHWLCEPMDEGIKPGSGSHTTCRKLHRKLLNYPQKAPDDEITVGNPKKLIEASLSNITALRTSLLASYLSVGLSYYDDGPNDTSATDAVVAYSMPIFQLTSAIKSMSKIKEIGEKAKEEAKKNLILEILTIVFMVIPFVGEELGPLVGSATTMARIGILIGEAGNAGLTIAEIVEDPSSAPFAIMGLIAGAGLGGEGKLSKEGALVEASKARSALKSGDLAKFPKNFRDQDALVQKVVKSLCGKK